MPVLRGRSEDNASLIIYCPTCSKDWNLKEEAPGERWAADFDFCGWDKEDDDAAIAAWNRRAIDRDELLKIAEELEAGNGCRLDEYHSVAQFAENAHEYERGIAYLIREAVGE